MIFPDILMLMPLTRWPLTRRWDGIPSVSVSIIRAFAYLNGKLAGFGTPKFDDLLAAALA
jgi:hypothetical protein